MMMMDVITTNDCDDDNDGYYEDNDGYMDDIKTRLMTKKLIVNF